MKIPYDRLIDQVVSVSDHEVAGFISVSSTIIKVD